MNLAPRYDPKPVESRWAQAWLDDRLGAPPPAHHAQAAGPPPAGRRPYVMMIPPPNVTGSLHMGHALNNVLQDTLARWRRMAGDDVLWLPGTDHGGIATQNVVEKLLKAEGVTRQALGREKFLERMWGWRRETGDTILGQLRRLGCSCDWERTRFTMDETCSKAVTAAFIRLYEEGLMYRGPRMVNWCVRCGTVLSDIEVEHEERAGRLWHVRYLLTEGGGEVIVATTRPETMLGDTAVAVHPADERYRALVGKRLRLPLVGRDIPIVADEAVDQTFGTGAVKVTPAHDPNDFEIAQRHGLPSIQVIGVDGRMTADAGRYAGRSLEQCREQVVCDLESAGDLVKVEPYRHSVGVCYRCLTTVEPLVSEQWFLKMDALARRAAEAIRSGDVRFHPPSWQGPALDWLEHIRDWCVSRQIWWGHRLPIWHCAAGCPPAAAASQPATCRTCGGINLEQDPDVLDTWFSSALWPFSTLGWPEHTPELARYYPGHTMVTGYEILYLWVVRMVMMGMHVFGEAPFSDVVLHGIVRDSKGKKMSKSLGNVVDPLTLMDKYGTDALRYSLAAQAAPGRDIAYGEQGVVVGRNFATKIWNAARLVLSHVPEPDRRGFQPRAGPERAGYPETPHDTDRWILSLYGRTIRDVTAALERFDLAPAARTLYDFFWGEYCDWYLELAKGRFAERETQATAVYVLEGTLRLLHPFMPFITSEIWEKMRSGSIARAPWPDASEAAWDEAAVSAIERLKAVVTAARNIRGELEVPAASLVELRLKGDGAAAESLRRHAEDLKRLVKASRVEIGPTVARPASAAAAVVADFQVFIPLAGVIDFQKEAARLHKKLEQDKGALSVLDVKLANPEFTGKAPPEEVARVRAMRADAQSRAERVRDYLKLVEQEQP